MGRVWRRAVAGARAAVAAERRFVVGDVDVVETGSSEIFIIFVVVIAVDENLLAVRQHAFRKWHLK